MKGFLACVLASVPLFKARKLKEPIHIIVSYDEEVGCTGVRPLIARLGDDLPRPARHHRRRTDQHGGDRRA